MTIRVVLADDHPMYRYGLAAVLEQADGIDVVASAGDGSALVGAVRDLSPDVVLTDLSIPGLDGIGAIRQRLDLQPELPILALTMHEDDAHVFAALRAGARGYLVKGADGAGCSARSSRASRPGVATTVTGCGVLQRKARRAWTRSCGLRSAMWWVDLMP